MIKPFVIDPTKIGPVNRCLICFAGKSKEVAYCENCGHMGSFFGFDDPPSGAACAFHPNVPAKRFCALCGKPICADCTEREGVSLVSLDPTPQCRACLRRSAELEKAFHERLEREKVCAKHSDESAALRCVECRLPHCERCLYFTTIGWMGKRLGIGPLCLVCFRMKTLSSGRESWISLPEARAKGLLRGIDPIALL
jgi:B-box zinc finger